MIDNNNNSTTLNPLIARLRENAGAILVRLVYNLPKDVPAKIKTMLHKALAVNYTCSFPEFTYQLAVRAMASSNAIATGSWRPRRARVVLGT